MNTKTDLKAISAAKNSASKIEKPLKKPAKKTTKRDDAGVKDPLLQGDDKAKLIADFETIKELLAENKDEYSWKSNIYLTGDFYKQILELKSKVESKLSKQVTIQKIMQLAVFEKIQREK